MRNKRSTQTCPICLKQHDEPVGVTRPTCGDPNCMREARARGLPWTISHDADYIPPEPRDDKGKKRRPKK